MITKKEFYQNGILKRKYFVDVSGLKQDVRHIQNVMVTKDYLDDKLADLHSDVLTIRT